VTLSESTFDAPHEAHEAELAEVGIDPRYLAARATSQRTRRTFMALQVFSLFVAALIFNTAYLNWTDARLHNLRLGRLLLKGPIPARLRAVDIRTGASDGIVPFDRNAGTDAGLWVHDYLESSRKARVEAPDSLDLVGAASLILQRGYDVGDIDQLIEKYQDIRVENVASIHVPLTGALIDSNGLGILASLGFSVLLLWLGMGLRREKCNLTFLRSLRRVRDVHALRMESLFAPHRSVSAIVDGAGPRGNWVDWVGVIAMWVPVLLLALQFGNDLITSGVGRQSSDLFTTVTLAIEALSLLFNVGLAFWCGNEYFGIVEVHDSSMRLIDRQTSAAASEPTFAT